ALGELLHAEEEQRRVLEALPVVVVPAVPPRLPGGDRGDVRDAVGLALVGHRVGGVRGGRAEDHVHLVAVDQLTGDLGGPVGVGLGVLDDDLDPALPAARGEAVPQRFGDLLDHEVVGAGEAGQRAGLRADVTDLEYVRGRGSGALEAAAGAQQRRPAEGGGAEADRAEEGTAVHAAEGSVAHARTPYAEQCPEGTAQRRARTERGALRKRRPEDWAPA